MLVALCSDGRLVNVLEQTCSKTEAYRCPACQAPVCFKQGKVMRSHFAHARLADCQFFHENESAEHLELKAALYRSLSAHGIAVEIEAVLPELGQVADLLVNDNLVLEVQCSRLSLTRLRERTVAYQQAGYQVIWLLGKKLWLGQTASQLHRQVANFSQNMGIYLWELDAAKQELRLRYLLHEDLTGRLLGLVMSRSLDSDIMTFLRQPFASQRPVQLTVDLLANPAAYVQRQLVQKNAKWLERQAQAYAQGDNLLTWPAAAFYPQVQPMAVIGLALGQYLAQFSAFYAKNGAKCRQTLYPPRFYAIMENRTKGKDQ